MNVSDCTLRSARELRRLIESSFPNLSRAQFIVPVAAEFVSMERQGFHQCVRRRHAFRVCFRVEFGSDPLRCIGAGIADGIDDGLEGVQRLASAIVRDVTEQPVLDLVPLAGAGRKERG